MGLKCFTRGDSPIPGISKSKRKQEPLLQSFWDANKGLLGVTLWLKVLLHVLWNGIPSLPYNGFVFILFIYFIEFLSPLFHGFRLLTNSCLCFFLYHLFSYFLFLYFVVYLENLPSLWMVPVDCPTDWYSASSTLMSWELYVGIEKSRDNVMILSLLFLATSFLNLCCLWIYLFCSYLYSYSSLHCIAAVIILCPAYNEMKSVLGNIIIYWINNCYFLNKTKSSLDVTRAWATVGDEASHLGRDTAGVPVEVGWWSSWSLSRCVKGGSSCENKIQIGYLTGEMKETPLGEALHKGIVEGQYIFPAIIRLLFFAGLGSWGIPPSFFGFRFSGPAMAFRPLCSLPEEHQSKAG